MNFDFVDGLSLEECQELKDLVSARLKSLKEINKAKKGEDKEEREKFAKENLKPGDKVSFFYKDATCEGEVVKLNAKTFTVSFEFEGEDKTLPRLYHLFIETVEQSESEVA